MSAVFDPLRDLIKQHADEARPLRLAEVTNTDQWSATGASFIRVLVGDAERVAIYRDGPQPAVGTSVQVFPTGPGAVAPWLALPLPLLVTPGAATCADSIFYVSAQAAGSWAILRFASLTGVGDAWSTVSASPTSGSTRALFWVGIGTPEHAYPFHGLADGVTDPGFTGVRQRFFTHGPGAGLYYSDDNCASWTSAGLSPLYVARDAYFGLMYACTAGAIYESADFGATWAAVPASAPPSGSWLYVASPFTKAVFDTRADTADFIATGGSAGLLRGGNTMPAYRGTIIGVTTTGAWGTINRFAPYAYPVVADPPFTNFDADRHRSWSDAGSDDGDFTVTRTFFGIPVQHDLPFVTTKPYRASYGPYGAAPQPGAFYSSGYNYSYSLPYFRATATATGGYSVVLPAKAGLPSALVAYDTATYKPLDAMWGYDYAGATIHLNPSGYHHQPLVVGYQGTTGGGIVFAFPGLSAWYWSAMNHPYGLTTVPALDAGYAASGCVLVGLDDTQGGGHCAFAIGTVALDPYAAPPWGAGAVNTDVFRDASATMLADLGAIYVASPDGIAAADTTSAGE